MQRVSVFLDVHNLFYAVKLGLNAKIDYAKLLSGITGGRELTAAFAYVLSRPTIDQKKFLYVLSANGFAVRERILSESNDDNAIFQTQVAKDVLDSMAKNMLDSTLQTQVTKDMLEVSGKTDAYCIGTGDGKFIPLVNAVKKTGKTVEIIGVKKSAHPNLVQLSDNFVDINTDWTISLPAVATRVIAGPAVAKQDFLPASSEGTLGSTVKGMIDRAGLPSD